MKVGWRRMGRRNKRKVVAKTYLNRECTAGVAVICLLRGKKAHRPISYSVFVYALHEAASLSFVLRLHPGPIKL